MMIVVVGLIKVIFFHIRAGYTERKKCIVFYFVWVSF